MNNSTQSCDHLDLFHIDFVSKNTDVFKEPLIVNIFLRVCSFLFATIGNGLVIAAILKSPNLQSPSFLLITSMAFTDLLVGLVYNPLIIVKIVYLLQKNYIVCRDNSLVNGTIHFISVMCFVMSLLISIDRYLALTLKQRYRLTITRRRVLGIVLSAWILVLFYTFTLFYVDELFPFWQDISTGLGILILLLICIFYVKSFVTLHRYTSQVHAQQPNTSQLHAQQPNPSQANFDVVKYKKSLNTMVIIMGCLLLCYIPILCGNFVVNSSTVTSDTVLFFQFSSIPFSINSCTNPVIYVVRFRDLGRAVRQNLRKLTGL